MRKTLEMWIEKCFVGICNCQLQLHSFNTNDDDDELRYNLFIFLKLHSECLFWFRLRGWLLNYSIYTLLLLYLNLFLVSSEMHKRFILRESMSNTTFIVVVRCSRRRLHRRRHVHDRMLYKSFVRKCSFNVVTKTYFVSVLSFICVFIGSKRNGHAFILFDTGFTLYLIRCVVLSCHAMHRAFDSYFMLCNARSMPIAHFSIGWSVGRSIGKTHAFSDPDAVEKEWKKHMISMLQFFIFALFLFWF